MIYEDGSYYTGGFSKGFKNGQGILYNKDSTVKVQGIFKNDKIEKESDDCICF